METAVIVKLLLHIPFLHPPPRRHPPFLHPPLFHPHRSLLVLLRCSHRLVVLSPHFTNSHRFSIFSLCCMRGRPCLCRCSSLLALLKDHTPLCRLDRRPPADRSYTRHDSAHASLQHARPSTSLPVQSYSILNHVLLPSLHSRRLRHGCHHHLQHHTRHLLHHHPRCLLFLLHLSYLEEKRLKNKGGGCGKVAGVL